MIMHGGPQSVDTMLDWTEDQYEFILEQCYEHNERERRSMEKNQTSAKDYREGNMM